jgi:hypothetical protein
MQETKPNYLLKFVLLPILLLVVELTSCQRRIAPSSAYRDWKVYGGGPDNIAA